MNWEIVSATGEWVGGLIVVLTIFYLSRQIRESNKHAKAQAEREVSSNWESIVVAPLIKDSELRSIIRKGNSSFGALTDDQKTVFMLHITHILNHLEMVLRMEQEGLLASDLADTSRNVCLSLLSTPGGREYWKIGRGMYQELSTSYVDQNIDQPGIPPISETLPFWSSQ